jgi:hypothetical protein
LPITIVFAKAKVIIFHQSIQKVVFAKVFRFYENIEHYQAAGMLRKKIPSKANA